MRVKLFYCHGTAYMFRWLGVPLALNLGFQLVPEGGGPSPGAKQTLEGLNGQTYPWDLFVPSDPFPLMLDPNVWDVKLIQYPASFFPLGLSINFGVDAVIDQINALPNGTPFALAGYSQGAAVMASVVEELQTGSLTARTGFLGGVGFGNPRRKTNYRGPVGGTWSGAMDIPGTTTGGGGSFPTTGTWRRMLNPPDTWVDFAAPGDVFTSVGNSGKGQGWVAANDVALDLSQSQLFTYLTTGLFDEILEGFQFFFATEGNKPNYLVDALDSTFIYTGNGHTVYPFLPPPNADGTFNTTTVTVGGQAYLKPVGDTCYQVALKYLTGLASQWSVAPIVIPQPNPVEAGWSPTLSALGSPALSAGWSTTL